MSKHTPGPWEEGIDLGTNDSGTIYHSATGDVIVDTVSGKSKEEAEANAKLIAAAPDLFDALGQLLDRLDHHGSIDTVREEGPIADAEAAIAKATTDEGR